LSVSREAGHSGLIQSKEVGAVFEAFVFEPDLNSLAAKNETGRAERPTRWEARSQDVEVDFVAHRNASSNVKI
jgi:hypothetical protein